jgi:periplasmic divalent cation tolerance protein
MIFVLTTVPSQKTGRRLAHLLVDGKLAACVSLSGAVESHYTWKKKRETAREYFLWIKTRRSLAQKVKLFLKKNHPYQVPEIAVLAVRDADKTYLRWLYGVTSL